jgi:hypothetical protein
MDAATPVTSHPGMGPTLAAPLSAASHRLISQPVRQHRLVYQVLYADTANIIRVTVGKYDGVAPDGKLVFIDLAKPGTGLCIPAAKELYSPGYNAGARVSSNSWGGYYTGSGYYASQDVDVYLYKRPVSPPLLNTPSSVSGIFSRFFVPRTAIPDRVCRGECRPTGTAYAHHRVQRQEQLVRRLQRVHLRGPQHHIRGVLQLQGTNIRRKVMCARLTAINTLRLPSVTEISCQD